MPTQSALKWSTATKTAACPRPVTVVVRSVPHVTSTASGMMVPSWARGPRPARRTGAGRREQAVLAHQARDTALRGADAAVPQPGPDLPVALAVEGAGGQDGPDRHQQTVVRHRPDRATSRRGGAGEAGLRRR
jgi:hypothetical protein